MRKRKKKIEAKPSKNWPNETVFFLVEIFTHSLILTLATVLFASPLRLCPFPSPRELSETMLALMCRLWCKPNCSHSMSQSCYKTLRKEAKIKWKKERKRGKKKIENMGLCKQQNWREKWMRKTRKQNELREWTTQQQKQCLGRCFITGQLSLRISLKSKFYSE